MKRFNSFTRLIALGVICANQGGAAPVSFAGVPHNFSLPQGGSNGNNNQPAPLSGNNNVPPVGPSLSPTASKVNPGVTSTSAADPNTNPQLLANASKGSSPLDKFATLFQNPSPAVGADGKPIPPKANVLDAGVGSYTELAKGINLAPVMSDEQKAALVKGGEGAVTALTEVLDAFGKQVFAHAASTSTAVTKRGLTEHSAEQQQLINNAIKLNGLSESLLNKDPRLSNPAVAPLVAVVQQQIAKGNPNATTQQLEGMVVEYFREAFGGFGTDPVTTEATRVAASKPAFNFLDFVSGKSQSA